MSRAVTEVTHNHTEGLLKVLRDFECRNWDVSKTSKED